MERGIAIPNAVEPSPQARRSCANDASNRRAAATERTRDRQRQQPDAVQIDELLVREGTRTVVRLGMGIKPIGQISREIDDLALTCRLGPQRRRT